MTHCSCSKSHFSDRQTQSRCLCRAQRGQDKAQSPAVQERQRAFQSLEGSLSNQLDPIDWATYEPYLWANEATYYQRAATLFGALLQTRRLHSQVWWSHSLLASCCCLLHEPWLACFAAKSRLVRNCWVTDQLCHS